MTAEQFIATRKLLGLSQKGLAQALGMSLSRIVDYELGYTRGRNNEAVIPRVVAIAVNALLQNVTQ